MAKVYKLIEISEYEQLKKLMHADNKSGVLEDDIKYTHEAKLKSEPRIVDSEETSNTSSSSSSGDRKYKSNFTECDWQTFEDCFKLGDGGKICRKKIFKRQKQR